MTNKDYEIIKNAVDSARETVDKMFFKGAFDSIDSSINAVRSIANAEPSIENVALLTVLTSGTFSTDSFTTPSFPTASDYIERYNDTANRYAEKTFVLSIRNKQDVRADNKGYFRISLFDSPIFKSGKEVW